MPAPPKRIGVCFRRPKTRPGFPRLVDAARHASELNNQIAPVHATLGLIYQGQGKYDDAIKEFQRALELDATSDAAYRGLASSVRSDGRRTRTPNPPTTKPSKCAKIIGADIPLWAPSTRRLRAMTMLPRNSVA